MENRVHPELKAALSSMPDMIITLDNLKQIRDIFATGPSPALPDSIQMTKRLIPGLNGAPDVPVIIFEPIEKTSDNLPGVLFMHGGAFVIGNANNVFCQTLVDEINCVVVSVEYRLAPENPYPAALEDCYAALKWLSENASEIGVDSSNIAVVGGSAGGGLTAALTLFSRDHKGPSIDLVLGFLRNFTGIMSDIKRRPELLRDAGLAMADEIAKIMTMPMFQPLDYGMLNCPLNLPAFIKPKDFQAIYWPSFKKLTDMLLAQGHRIMFAFEKNYSHLYNYLQEFPKYKISGVFNEDDIRVVKKKLGDRMAIFGGLSVNMMRNGTKQECIDHVKGLIDDLGRDGGYCITPDIPMMTSADGKPENLKVVADTILAYGRN